MLNLFSLGSGILLFLLLAKYYRHYAISLPLFLLCPMLLSAQQKVNVSLYFGGNYTQISAPNTTLESLQSRFYSSGRNSTGDSIITVARVSIQNEFSHSFEGRPGGEVGLTFDFPINDKLSISTGIGLSSLSYKPEDTFLSSQVNRAVDTVFVTSVISETTNSNPFNSQCDTFINSTIITTIEESHDLIFLQIPINLKYQAIKELLTINAGLYINTPLYAQETTTRFFLDRQLRTRDDGTDYYECKNLQGAHSDRSGSRFRDFTFGVNLGANYHLTSKFSIGLQFSRLFLPLYNPPTTNAFSFNFTPSDVRPILNKGAISLHYHFNKTVKEMK